MQVDYLLFAKNVNGCSLLRISLFFFAFNEAPFSCWFKSLIQAVKADCLFVVCFCSCNSEDENLYCNSTITTKMNAPDCSVGVLLLPPRRLCDSRS